MGRILAIDYGDRHLGLALSDPLQITAQPFGTYTLKDDQAADLAFFQKLVEEQDVEEIVLSWPLRMDGSPGRRTEVTREFAVQLETATGRKVIFWDERLTTQQAQRKLEGFKGNYREKKRREDQLAAVIILEAYLEKKRHHADHTPEGN